MLNLPRSLSLRFLALVLLGLAAYNALGALSGLGGWALLKQLPLDVPAPYLVASRAVWAAGWAGLAGGVWQRRRWARWGALMGTLAYLGHGWLNRLVWGNSDYALQMVPWNIGAGLLAVALAAWVVGRPAPWR